jgi:hypothetical protein
LDQLILVVKNWPNDSQVSHVVEPQGSVKFGKDGSNEVEALNLLELEFQDENVEEDLDN